MRRVGPSLWLAAWCAAAPATYAAVVAGKAHHVRLTIYTGGSSLVGERRVARLPHGVTRLVMDGLPAQLKADSVRLQAPGMEVISENFDDHVLTAATLRERALGKTVDLYPKSRTGARAARRATLVAAGAGAPVVRLGDHLEVIDAASPWRIVYPARLAAGGAGATVTARVKGPTQGPVELTYLTDGLSWHADYVASLNAGAGKLGLAAFASVRNTSGADYVRARVNVVAGQPHRTAQPRAPVLRMAAQAAPTSTQSPRKLFEYYTYRLPAPLTLANRTTVRVPLFAQQQLAVTSEYRIEGTATRPLAAAASDATPRHAQVILHWRNTTGRPLPAGEWRLYGEQDGAPALLGEDRLADVPEGEAVAMPAGRAFDVTARRTEIARKRVNDQTWSAQWRVTVRNAKHHAVKVRVVEPLPGDWTIEQESAKHRRVDAGHAAWTLTVPAAGGAQLTYRVRWR